MSAGADRQAFWAKCRGCGHCWPAAYLPMELTTCAKLLSRARCPMCGDGKPLVAKQDGGVLLEPAAARAITTQEEARAEP